jgi:glycerophosphoryl diester phosphodiesterase
VLVYTVDSPADMRAVAALGVDAIVTNFPERLAALGVDAIVTNFPERLAALDVTTAAALP